MSLISRHLIREFSTYLLLSLAGLVLLYLIIDLFDRLDILLENDASLSASLRYFGFKVPLIVTQILPASAMIAVLTSLGLMARYNEITAFHAAGISFARLAAPLIAVSLALSIAVLIWNETIVPFATKESQHVNRVEIRKRGERSVLSERGIWYRGGAGLYNIDYFDKHAGVLHGLTVYRVDERFQLEEIIEVGRAKWTGEAWELSDAWRRGVNGAQDHARVEIAGNEVVIPEAIADFQEVRLDAEELSYLALRRRIDRLASQGVDASHYSVELSMKLAVPFANLVLMCIGIPLAGRLGARGSLAAAFGGALVVGFAYWLILGFTRSLGETGVLPPAIAAWAPNALGAMVAAALFLRRD